MFVDTHCHIHESTYPLDRSETVERARHAGIAKMICVGTSIDSSKEAIDLAASHDGVYAAVGVHPHDTKDGYTIDEMASASKVVAVGEIGLDYYYNHSPKEVQIEALKHQIEVALDHDLPIIFHVREAFDDFWPIFDVYSGIRGVLHSFTDSQENLEKAIERGLFIGVNGIATFTKSPEQLAMYDAVPLNKLMLETDAPFLTPSPLRGTINEPALVRTIGEFIATRRGLPIDEVATLTTSNANALFAL